MRDWQELPDAVKVAGAPGFVCDESELEESLESAIDGITVNGQANRHAFATIEGSTLSVCGEGQQDKDGRWFRTKSLEPALIE